jgi:ABC-type nickel/cobalt efflux system permease component RcnA
MFRRLLLDQHAAVFAVVAFVTVAAIFLFMTWRAVRMSRTQIDRFARLPFNSDSENARHDHSA